jgi:Rrf2 family transcriptional regulator, cysteine metabolism repressor
MMQVSQRSRYALRALFELAKREGDGPSRIGDIAEAQAIPPRFLEVILNQLRQAGFVRSVRGAHGGYALARSPREITVGEMMRFTEGSLVPLDCTPQMAEPDCPLYGECVFQEMWERAGEALAGVYDATSFQDLLDADEQRRLKAGALTYAI